MGDRQERVPSGRMWARQNVIVLVLSIFIIFSTLLSAVTLLAVYRVRVVLRGQLEAAARNVGELRQQTIRYDFPINQGFPINTVVQLDETLNIPIDMKVPIRQNITVPVGPVEFPVALNFDVPISTTVPVRIKRDIPVHTNVELNTKIPLEVNLGASQAGDVLRKLQEALEALLKQL